MRARRLLASGVTGVVLALVWAPPAGAGAANGSPDVTSASAASPVSVGGGWSTFYFGGVGSRSDTFTFDHSGPAVVTVTDAFCYGDVFSVHDEGVTLGQTSPSDPTGCDGPSDPDEALSDPGMSHGQFVVGAGAHALVIEAVASPWGSGGAYLRVDPAPTPRTKADCKNGQWAHLYDNEGQTFRNQGSCVSSVVRQAGG